jgi:hypothetical protein
MQTKLTLRINNQLIAKVKRIAQHKGTSVSDMVARLIEVMPDSDLDENWKQDLSPQLQNLIGIAPSSHSMTDEQIAQEYKTYLEEKYR